MNAAMKEFAQRPYQEISISQICNHLFLEKIFIKTM